VVTESSPRWVINGQSSVGILPANSQPGRLRYFVSHPTPGLIQRLCAQHKAPFGTFTNGPCLIIDLTAIGAESNGFTTSS